MCGRFVSTTPPQQLADYFSVDALAAPDPSANYNVAPTHEVVVIAEDENHHRVLDRYRWGLIPSWAKDPKVGNRMINARAETAATKPSYRKPFAKRRCIIPADGFYEWKKEKDGTRKQPYFIHPTVEPVFAFAGLWDRWHDDGADVWVRSCTILTGDPNARVSEIHDRMPVILPREHWDAWLDPENDDVEALQALLVPAPVAAVALYAVRTVVNTPKNNNAANLEPDPDPVV